MGKVQNAVQFHVDDGDVQVAERICQGREQNLNKKEVESVTNRIFKKVSGMHDQHLLYSE